LLKFIKRRSETGDEKENIVRLDWILADDEMVEFLSGVIFLNPDCDLEYME